jgi:hypothetical protein
MADVMEELGKVMVELKFGYSNLGSAVAVGALTMYGVRKALVALIKKE